LKWQLRWSEMLEFTLLFLLIVLISFYSKIIILAPPFGVSAYLITTMKSAEISRRSSILIMYSYAAGVAVLFHTFVGDGTYSMLFSVLAVAAFMVFSGVNHPPAIALAIFSYLQYTHPGYMFIIISFAVALLIVSVSSLFSAIRNSLHRMKK